MSVSERQAELEDLETGERVRVLLDEVEADDADARIRACFRKKTRS